jgi:hypothetical protein
VSSIDEGDQMILNNYYDDYFNIMDESDIQKYNKKRLGELLHTWFGQPIILETDFVYVCLAGESDDGLLAIYHALTRDPSP